MLDRQELDPGAIAVAMHMIQSRMVGIVQTDSVKDLLTFAVAMESLATEYRVMAAQLPVEGDAT